MTPEALAALAANAYRHTLPWSAQDFADTLADPNSLLVCDPDGFVLGRIVAEDAEVLALAVAPAAQGNGRARALLTRFETEAGARGAAAVFLEVAEANGPARALYRAAGYTQVGLRRGYYRRADGPPDAALCLRKLLTRGPDPDAAAESAKSG